MKSPKISKRFLYRTLVLVVNVVAVAIILFVLLTYFRSESTSRQERNRQQFEAVTDSVAQTILGRLEAHQEIVNAATKYIGENDMTIDEAIDFVDSINTDENHMFHIVWVDDFTGLSTRANKLDDTDYTVDYSGISTIRFEDENIITAMSILYDENSDKFIHATRAFYNPIDASSTVAFYSKIYLDRDGEESPAILMLLADVDDLRSEYSFPEGIFEDTQTAVIDTASGYYVLPTPELKNSSFYEYLRQYNDDLDYTSLQELEERIAEGQLISETYKDYKGQDVRFIISEVEGADGWTLVSFIPVETLNKLSSDNLWLVTVILIALITILLFGDIFFFMNLNNDLEKALSREELAKAQAEKANRSKTDFLSTMSHDIRTPLNAILGLTTLTKDKVDDKALVEKNLKKIDQSGQHLLTLINDVLDISKIESGQLSFNVNPFSITEVEEYLKDLCMPMAKEKGLDLDISVEKVTEDDLLGDKLRIYQVMINILTNAIKYTNAGGFVKVRLAEECLDDNNIKLSYEVEDNGIGMTEEFMEHMYETFSRAKDGRIDKVQGTGLGLAICKRIIDGMGGEITCRSKVNEGTCFKVELMLQRVQKNITKTTDSENQELKNIRILVAEDNDLNYEIISEMLEIKEISCDRAENGQIAYDALLATAEEKIYDLVLMDIQMPVLNGIEATKKIRATDNSYVKGIPIIALTADAFAENIEECISAGMNSHVAKPINIDILMSEIVKVISQKGVNNEN